jgi:hypothetical protein
MQSRGRGVYLGVEGQAVIIVDSQIASQWLVQFNRAIWVDPSKVKIKGIWGELLKKCRVDGYSRVYQ